MSKSGQNDTPRLLPLREQPALLEQAVAWFSSKWNVPAAAYRESMTACLAGAAVPQWYLLVDAQGNIAGGAGVIENDFHDRPDLAPNLCALYVEPVWRGRGLAGLLLNSIRADMAALPPRKAVEDKYYLGFYEEDRLIAVMDLILGFPKEETAFVGFFMMNKDLLRDTDSLLREETDLRKLVLQKGYDTVIADRSLMPLLEGLPVRLLHLPHFAVSGEQSLP
jgi:GNAT superfamily N-acetyltransferase